MADVRSLGAWKRLRGLWCWSRRRAGEHRTARARARFWTEVRDGEREAEAAATLAERNCAGEQQEQGARCLEGRG